MNNIEKYNNWIKNASDNTVKAQLNAMSGDEDAINDAFYRDLEFGTGGLRGVMGAGTNRMNIYVIRKATQGLSDYLKSGNKEKYAVAIGYDSRHFSREFACAAAEVFAANDITSFVYDRLVPTPCLSFAVREVGCDAGVMITASHNPSEYNGYKVYGADGCQITTEAADKILAEINKLDIFEDVKTMPFFEGSSKGLIRFIDPTLYSEFSNRILSLSKLYDAPCDFGIKIVYTPLNGAGLIPVTEVLSKAGFENVSIVEAQSAPDGDFPTCPYPNPEIPEAMELGISIAKDMEADVLMATDPDSDRCGIAIPSGGDFKLLNGNETGILLLNYVCERMKMTNTFPANPVFIKTIVTTPLAEKIAESFGIKTINVLTGFKFIGEQIGKLEAEGREADYVFGFEESCGYLSGTHVRDKDAVNASLLIAEMCGYYKALGISLAEKLECIYKEFGTSESALHSYSFPGESGFNRMKDLMDSVRAGLKKDGTFGKIKVQEYTDYINGIDGLPKSDVVSLKISPDESIIIRPSGTEPKLKAYITAKDKAGTDRLSKITDEFFKA
ncbi:MAG: phospho-sugar mutase [Lachnospiraceae bacterium]|nr:phospho-sugar mutase [Lachnospiraceae bacterium]